VAINEHINTPCKLSALLATSYYNIIANTLMRPVSSNAYTYVSIV